MLLVVKYCLVQVADTPAQRNVIVEQFGKLGSGLARVRIAPGTEGHQNLLLLVECHIAVHHGRETDGCQRLYLAVVLLLYVFAQLGVAILQTVPDGFGRVSPKTVDELVLPLVTALSDGFVVLVDKYGLNTRGTELDSQNGFSSLDCLLCGHCFFSLKVLSANLQLYF